MAITQKPQPIIRCSQTRTVTAAQTDDAPVLSVTTRDLCEGSMGRCRREIAEFMLVYGTNTIQCFTVMHNGLRWTWGLLLKKRGRTGRLCVTKQEEHPEAVLSNLLHTEAKRLWSVCRWRVLSRMWLSSSRGSLEFPLSLFTSLAQPREPSLEESGKHQQGMTGISAFHSPRPQPPPTPLNSGCLRTARLLSFLLFLNTAQQ